VAVLPDDDADRAIAGDDQALREGVGHDVQVGPFHRRLEEGVGGADAAAPVDRGHRVRDALVVGLVDVVDAPQPQLRAGGEHLLAHRVGVAGNGEAQRTAGAARR
jgi:hypothetical protein